RSHFSTTLIGRKTPTKGRVRCIADVATNTSLTLYLGTPNIPFSRKQIMPDPTESLRRQRLAEINSDPNDRAALESRYGQVWDTTELGRDFVITGFAAPLVVVKRKAD